MHTSKHAKQGCKGMVWIRIMYTQVTHSHTQEPNNYEALEQCFITMVNILQYSFQGVLIVAHRSIWKTTTPNPSREACKSISSGRRDCIYAAVLTYT